MLVLLDAEWIETEEERQLTQLAAMRVDGGWTSLECFDAIIKPAAFAASDPAHMAFNGYRRERFKAGETEESAIRRFSAWLYDTDEICIWHPDTGDVLAAAWQSILHQDLPNRVIRTNIKICRAVRKKSKLGSLYAIAADAGIPVVTPHCAADDVALMRQLLLKVDLSQQQLRTEPQEKQPQHTPPAAKPATSIVARNRDILQRVSYQYIFLPNSAVFHTKTCPCILRAEKLEGAVYYKTAARSRRPCKRCNPTPEIQKTPAAQPKASSKPAVNYKELIQVKLLGGAVVRARRGNIIGYCHYAAHAGKLTRAILQRHRCIEKNCRFLERYTDVPFWTERERKKNAKTLAKQRKKKQKAVLLAQEESMIELRDRFQSCADATASALDVVRVERPNGSAYVVFYVSDYDFADGNRFPEFLEKLRQTHSHRRIILRHIKDEDGRFVTRAEYYARKRSAGK